MPIAISVNPFIKSKNIVIPLKISKTYIFDRSHCWFQPTGVSTSTAGTRLKVQGSPLPYILHQQRPDGIFENSFRKSANQPAVPGCTSGDSQPGATRLYTRSSLSKFMTSSSESFFHFLTGRSGKSDKNQAPHFGYFF